MNNMEENYKNLLALILNEGHYRKDRTGVGSYSVFSKDLFFDHASGYFPMITGKKMFFKTTYTEFLWFINGETNIKRFKEQGVKIWDHWADEDGELGPVYGHQMINFNNQHINQLDSVVESLKNNPDSRRHIISLWNPVQLGEMRLPPCYLYFQFFTRGNIIDLQVVQRSADLFLGVPYDITLFSLFMHYIGFLTGLTPGQLKLTMVDVHIYQNQIDQVNEYLKMEHFEMPKLIFNRPEDVHLIGYNSNNFIKTPVAI